MNLPPEPQARSEAVASPPGNKAGNAIIESLGVYLPPRIVSSAEVMRNCKHPVSFQLERMTGIRSRRMAGDDAFSIDLAHRASR